MDLAFKYLNISIKWLIFLLKFPERLLSIRSQDFNRFELICYRPKSSGQLYVYVYCFLIFDCRSNTMSCDLVISTQSLLFLDRNPSLRLWCKTGLKISHLITDNSLPGYLGIIVTCTCTVLLYFCCNISTTLALF